MTKNTAPIEKIILGIDPGTLRMGFGIITQSGSRLSFVTMNVLNLTKLTDPSLKLKKIFEATLSLIDLHHPDAIAIETPFFGKNVQSMLKLGRAQGVAIAAAMIREVPVFEYAPLKIKQAITGKGSSSKEQVAAMLNRLIKITEIPESLDATDALAAAVCHALQKTTSNETKSASWKNFITKNENRIIKN